MKLKHIFFLIFFTVVLFSGVYFFEKYLQPEKITPPPPVTTTVSLDDIPVFTSTDMKYAFPYPEFWQVGPTDVTTGYQTTAFTSCGITALKVTELSISALRVKKDTPASKVDEHLAYIVSNPESSVATIVATESGKLIQLEFRPTCDEELDSSKEKYFFPLLSYFKFL